MKVIRLSNPMHRLPLPPIKYSWYSFLFEAESTPGAIVWQEVLCRWNITETPSGIESATFRLVAECLNHAIRYETRHDSYVHPSRESWSSDGSEAAVAPSPLCQWRTASCSNPCMRPTAQKPQTHEWQSVFHLQNFMPFVFLSNGTTYLTAQVVCTVTTQSNRAFHTFLRPKNHFFK